MTFSSLVRHQRVARKRRGTRLGTQLHGVMPSVVVIAALVLQLAHNAIPVLSLIALLSAAYGRLMWLEFMAHNFCLALLPSELPSEFPKGTPPSPPVALSLSARNGEVAG